MKPNTLTLIRTDKGRIFGGYAEAFLPNSQKIATLDPKAFLFSVDKKTICRFNPVEKSSIKCLFSDNSTGDQIWPNGKITQGH